MTEHSLRLGSGCAAAIRRHGSEAYPHECCGALLGTAGRVSVALPLPNTTAEGSRRRFLVQPSDYRLAEERARDLGVELLGFYHSHPDQPAQPSQFDLDHAWPTFAYIIVSIVDGAAAKMSAWWLGDDRSAFAEGDLHHDDENSDTDASATVHRQTGRGVRQGANGL